MNLPKFRQWKGKNTEELKTEIRLSNNSNNAMNSLQLKVLNLRISAFVAGRQILLKLKLLETVKVPFIQNKKTCHVTKIVFRTKLGYMF